MSITSLKYNLTFIVLFVGMTSIHADNIEDRVDNIVLYCTNWSVPCRAVKMLLNVLDVKYDTIETNPMKKESYTDKFLELNPEKTIPYIRDKKFHFGESRAILVYLARMYGKGDNETLFPDDNGEEDIISQAKINLMLMFDMQFMTPAAEIFGKWLFIKSPLNEYKMNKIQEALQMFDTLLEKYFTVGNKLTVADVALFANIITIQAFGQDLSKFTNITNWFEDCKKKITNYDTINNSTIEFIIKSSEARKEEDKKDMVDKSVANRDVYVATKTLIKAVQSEVLSRKHLLNFNTLLKAVTPLVNVP